MAGKQNRQTFSEFEADKILWSDRKRWLGMPLTFTKYTVDENRLYIKRGFFKTVIDETLLYRILDIKSSATFGQKLCGVGTVTLFCNDKSNPVLELKNIKHAEKVRRFLSAIIEERRQNVGVTGREMYGTGKEGHPPMGHDHDDCLPDDFPSGPPDFDGEDELD
jgi:hypothetical protein